MAGDECHMMDKRQDWNLVPRACVRDRPTGDATTPQRPPNNVNLESAQSLEAQHLESEAARAAGRKQSQFGGWFGIEASGASTRVAKGQPRFQRARTSVRPSTPFETCAKRKTRGERSEQEQDQDQDHEQDQDQDQEQEQEQDQQSETNPPDLRVVPTGQASHRQLG